MGASSYFHTLTHAPLWQYVALSGLAYIIYSLLVAVYRLTLHPLSKYPGPLFSAISSYAIFLQTTTGDRHLQSYLEHEKYGPIVRIGPNALSTNTTGALHAIYLSRKANVQKSEWYRTIDAPSGAFSTHSEIDRVRHAARRRVLDHAFSDAALRSAEVFILENVRTFCTQLGTSPDGAGWSSPKNMSHWSTYLNYDIMGSLVFGKEFDCLSATANRYIADLMMSSTMFIYPVAHLPFAWLLRPLLANERLMAMIPGKMTQDTAAYIAYANAQMGERIAFEDQHVKEGRESERKDFMHYLLHARDPLTGKGFTRKELDADASLLIAAGADTTSTALAAALFYLTLHPDVWRKLVAELDRAFPSDDVEAIRYPQVGQLVYLRAVMDETLRLAPPVPTQLHREVLPGGIEIDGETLPAGTVVGTSAYCIHHNETYYPDSWAFQPERWIVDGDGTNKEQVKMARDAFCAFSLGSRGCVGKNVAYMELGITLARVLWLFEMRRVDAGVQDVKRGTGKLHEMRVREDEFQLIDHFLADRDGPVLQFRRRARDQR